MARSFDGSTQRIDRASIPYIAYPFSYAAWIRPSAAFMATSGTGGVIAGVSSGANTAGPFLRVNASNDRLEVGVSDAVGMSSPATALTADVWAHVAGVFASATSRTGYLNGSAGTAGTNNKTFVVNNVGMRFGARQGPGGGPYEWFGGDIAEAAIWDIDLSASDAASLAKGVSPLLIRPANLVLYAPLFGRASPEPEWISAATLTLSGAPPQTTHPRVRPPRRWNWPVRSSGGLSVSPSLGALSLASAAPTIAVTNPIRVQPSFGALSIEGVAPSIRLGAPPPSDDPPADRWRNESEPNGAGWAGHTPSTPQWQTDPHGSIPWSSDS